MAATGVRRSDKGAKVSALARLRARHSAPAVAIVRGVEEDEAEARVDDAEVEAQLVESLVEQGREQRGGEVDGLAGRRAPPRAPRRPGGGSLLGGLIVPGDVGPPVGREQPSQRGMVEREPLALEVRRQGGEMLGHVPVDVDDGVAKPAADLGGGTHRGLIYAHYSLPSSRGLMPYDMVIRNGTVVDGSGLGSFRADVGIVDGRIAFVGRVPQRGAREIDAEGHVVTPGFIDGHTHMDAQVFWDATGASSCWHGVTSAVMGNCGFTLAPVRPDQRALVVRNLERAEDMDPAALAAGIDWSFETFPQYLDAVDRLPKGINFAANIGHSALRTWAMGERAFEQEATPEDLVLMKRQLAEALAAGAIGFSTSRSRAPRDIGQPTRGLTPGVVGRGRPARAASWARRAAASSRAPTAPWPPPIPKNADKPWPACRSWPPRAMSPSPSDWWQPDRRGICSTFSTRPPPPGAGSSPRPIAGASRCCCR